METEKAFSGVKGSSDMNSQTPAALTHWSGRERRIVAQNLRNGRGSREALSDVEIRAFGRDAERLWSQAPSRSAPPARKDPSPARPRPEGFSPKRSCPPRAQESTRRRGSWSYQETNG